MALPHYGGGTTAYPLGEVRHGYCICLREFDRTYMNPNTLEPIDVFFKHSQLFEYTSTSGWFYELTVGSYKMVFEDSDFHDYFGRLTKEEYREHKLDKVFNDV